MQHYATQLDKIIKDHILSAHGHRGTSWLMVVMVFPSPEAYSWVRTWLVGVLSPGAQVNARPLLVFGIHHHNKGLKAYDMVENRGDWCTSAPLCLFAKSFASSHYAKMSCPRLVEAQRKPSGRYQANSWNVLEHSDQSDQDGNKTCLKAVTC